MSTPGSSDLVSPTVAPYPPSTDYISSTSGPPRSCVGCDRSSVNLALYKKRPDNPRHLVGERNRHQHARFASQHLFEPRTPCCAAFARLLYDSTTADDEEAPERALAHFERCAKPLLAACQSLNGRETEPGGKVAALSKGLDRRC